MPLTGKVSLVLDLDLDLAVVLSLVLVLVSVMGEESRCLSECAIVCYFSGQSVQHRRHLAWHCVHYDHGRWRDGDRCARRTADQAAGAGAEDRGAGDVAAAG